MNAIFRHRSGMRRGLARAAVLAAGLLAPLLAPAQQPPSYQWILVQPPPANATDAELETARAQWGVQQADRVLVTPSGMEIWRTTRTGEAQSARGGYGKYEVLKGGDPREIFLPVDEAALAGKVKANLAKVRARGYAKRVQVVHIQEARIASLALRYADSVTWRLFDKVRIVGTRHAKFSRVQNTGRFAWVGGLDVKSRDCDAALFANGFASLTFGNGNLYGRLEHGKDIYQIIPLGGGYHATVEVDPDKLPDQPDLANIEDEGGDMLDLATIQDEGGDMLDLPTIGDEGGDMLDRKGLAGRTPPTFTTCSVDIPRCNTGAKAARATIRIGVAFTREAMQDVHSGAQHFADYLVNITNAAFARSGVNSRVELAGTHVFDKLENAYPDSKALLAALVTSPPPASVAPVQQWRDNKGADVVVLITHDATYPGVGAVAGLSPPPGTLGNPAQAWSIVPARFADAQLSFQHELGHVLGAGHNWQANTPASFTYGHGFRNQCQWRTVMSYEDRAACNNHGTPRYALYSACNVVVNGNTLAGGLLENNTRVLNEQAEAISKYRP
jgi:Metallo-peptidase family M12B Reprolysin-like